MTYSLDYRLTITCNDIKVLDLLMSDPGTCNDKDREKWLRGVTMTSIFPRPYDTASDFYCKRLEGTFLA